MGITRVKNPGTIFKMDQLGTLTHWITIPGIKVPRGKGQTSSKSEGKGKGKGRSMSKMQEICKKDKI